MMFARTERLLLRPGFIEDAPALTAALGDEAVVRHLAQVPWPYRPENAAEFLTMPQDPLLPRMLITQRTAGAPRIVGGIGIHRQAEGTETRLDLGYWIARPYWGLGFATEAGRAVMALARTIGLPRLSARHFVDNPASGNVLRKLGFRPTGRVIPASNALRGTAAPCAEFEEADDQAGDAMRGRGSMRGKRSRVSAEEDERHMIRLLAA